MSLVIFENKGPFFHFIEFIFFSNKKIQVSSLQADFYQTWLKSQTRVTAEMIKHSYCFTILGTTFKTVTVSSVMPRGAESSMKSWPGVSMRTKILQILPRGDSVRFEPPHGKTNSVVSEQVLHKPGCTCKEKS